MFSRVAVQFRTVGRRIKVRAHLLAKTHASGNFYLHFVPYKRGGPIPIIVENSSAYPWPIFLLIPCEMVSRSSWPTTRFPANSLFNILQTFSIGLASGRSEGQCSVSMPFSVFHLVQRRLRFWVIFFQEYFLNWFQKTTLEDWVHFLRISILDKQF